MEVDKEATEVNAPIESNVNIQEDVVMTDKPSNEVVQESQDKDEEEDAQGTTVLPMAKVKRILKIDPSYTLSSESSGFVVAKSTEFFVKYLAQQASVNAKLEKRKKVQYKDFSAAVHSRDQLQFLKKLVPQTISVRKLVAEDKIKFNKGTSDLKIAKPKATRELVPAAKEKQPLLKGQQVLNFPSIRTVTGPPEEELSDSDSLGEANGGGGNDAYEEEDEQDQEVVEAEPEEETDNGEDEVTDPENTEEPEPEPEQA